MFSEKAYRSAVFILFLLVLISALVGGLRTVSDFDMGWHLATGRYVVQHRAIPSTDVLSYTSAGTSWIYPPFAGVLLYLAYSGFGYAGLSWFCALASVTTIACLVRRRDISSIALAVFAVIPIAFRIGPRADLFNIVFFAIFLGELAAFQRGCGARLWLLPLLMLFWVNFHPGFIAGLAVIAAYLLMEGTDVLFVERRKAGKQRLRQVWPWLAGTAVVTLINPCGPKLYVASLKLAGLIRTPGTLDSSASILEFMPVPLSRQLFVRLFEFRDPESGFSWLMLAGLSVIILALRRKRFDIMFVEIAALYGSIQHIRFIAFFCITTVILGGPLLAELFTTKPLLKSADERSGGRLHAPLPVAVVFVCALCALTVIRIADLVSNRTYVLIDAETRFGAGESFWFPERAASFIEKERLPGNVFEEFAVGGFAAWRLGPAYKNFIDGRADHLAPAVFAEEQKLSSHSPDSELWQAAANRWGINVLLISEVRAPDRLDALPFCTSSAWRPVYMDEVSLLLLRNVPENRTWLERLQIDCRAQQLSPPRTRSRKQLYDFYANAGGLLYALRRDQESEQALLRAAALYPEDANVDLVLARLYQRHKVFDKAESRYRASLIKNESDKCWYELGRLYALEERLSEAEEAFQRAARMSVNPYIPYMALAEIELALHRPNQALQAFAKAEKTSPYRNGGEPLAPELYAQLAAGRAEAYHMLAQLALAIDFQQEAVRLTPAVASRWNKLAELYDSAGQVQASAQARQRAHELSTQAVNRTH